MDAAGSARRSPRSSSSARSENRWRAPSRCTGCPARPPTADRERSAGAEGGLDLVHDQQRAVSVALLAAPPADTSGARSRCRLRPGSARAGSPRSGRRRRPRGRRCHSGETGSRVAPAARTAPVLRIECGGQRARGAAMVAALGRDDLGPTGHCSRELESRLDRLRPGVCQEMSSQAGRRDLAATRSSSAARTSE